MARQLRRLDPSRLPAALYLDGTEGENLVVDAADVFDAPAAFWYPDERVELWDQVQPLLRFWSTAA